MDILPETLKRRVQRTWHQKYSLVLFLSFSFFIHGLVNFYMIHCGSRYDALLSQNKQLRKQIVATDCTLKEKQKEVRLKLFITKIIALCVRNILIYRTNESFSRNTYICIFHHPVTLIFCKDIYCKVIKRDSYKYLIRL